MPRDGTYNGWTNWETWAVKLYQDNEEQSNREVAALAVRCAQIKLGQVTGKVFDLDIAIAAFKRVMAPAFRQVKREWLEWRTERQDEPRALNVNWAEITMAYIDDEVTEIEYAEKKGRS